MNWSTNDTFRKFAAKLADVGTQALARGDDPITAIKIHVSVSEAHRYPFLQGLAGYRLRYGTDPLWTAVNQLGYVYYWKSLGVKHGKFKWGEFSNWGWTGQ